MTEKNIMQNNFYTKKLLYQSCNRGCKEMDIILGNFAKQRLSSFAPEDLVLYEEILKYDDVDLYNWYTKKQAIPADCDSKIMQQIIDFKLYNKK